MTPAPPASHPIPEPRAVPEPTSLAQAPRCGARTRCGAPCRSPAVQGRARCRMHGGKGSGAPRGNRNAWKHGGRSAWIGEVVRFLRATSPAAIRRMALEAGAAPAPVPPPAPTPAPALGAGEGAAKEKKRKNERTTPCNGKALASGSSAAPFDRQPDSPPAGLPESPARRPRRPRRPRRRGGFPGPVAATGGVQLRPL
ncbi:MULTISPECIES: HGGxSTG domain-containing protein [unclassified Sphingomonas]|uniref:HGGxSTG domain-containing protein n=1 Tax=unclassified Sphingomonas TaxID=196159 RepID=UPI0009E8370E